MAKVAPRQRWERHIIERIKALRLSGELKPLRRKGLKVLGRKSLYTTDEWRATFSERSHSKDYMAWYKECELLADEFALAPWTVVMLCMVKGYRPEKDVSMMAMEGNWPRIRVVTDSDVPAFLEKLSYEAQQLGLYVIHRQGSFETTLLNLENVGPGELSKHFTNRNIGHNEFSMRVETPIGYPPEAAAQLQKEAARLGRELSRRLGFPTPKRLRSSKLVTMAEELKVADWPLPRGAAYDIVDRVYRNKDMSKDQQRRKLVASRRHKLHKRLQKSTLPDSKPRNSL